MYSPRGRALLLTSPGPEWVIKGTNTMLAPGGAPPGAIGAPTTQHKVLRGVLQPGDKVPAGALAQITSGRAGYHLELAMFCLSHLIKPRSPSTGTVLWIWAIPTAHRQVEAGPDTRKDPPPGHNTPAPAGTTPCNGSSAAWTLAHPYSTLFSRPTMSCSKYAHSSAKALPRLQRTASFCSIPPGLQETTQARRCKRTRTTTQHTQAKPHTPPLCPRPCAPPPLPTQQPTHARQRAQPHPADHPHMPATDPPAKRPSRPPKAGQPTETCREELHAPQHTNPAP